MASFEPAYRITRAHEDGYANLAADKGGETWRGVARKSNPTWPGWKIVDAIKANDLANLNVALAGSKKLDALVLALFRKGYWDCLSLDSLHCQQTASQLFDVSVNCGSGTAARFLQQALNVFPQPALVVDGKVGRLTIAAANQYPSQKIYDEINKLRSAHFLNIIARDATQGIFKDGGLSRIKPFQPDNASNNQRGVAPGARHGQYRPLLLRGVPEGFAGAAFAPPSNTTASAYWRASTHSRTPVGTATM